MLACFVDGVEFCCEDAGSVVEFVGSFGVNSGMTKALPVLVGSSMDPSV